MTDRPCSHVTCNKTGDRCRKVVTTEELKWYCPDHDPLQDPRVAAGFVAVEADDDG